MDCILFFRSLTSEEHTYCQPNRFPSISCLFESWRNFLNQTLPTWHLQRIFSSLWNELVSGLKDQKMSYITKFLPLSIKVANLLYLFWWRCFDWFPPFSLHLSSFLVDLFCNVDYRLFCSSTYNEHADVYCFFIYNLYPF